MKFQQRDSEAVTIEVTEYVEIDDEGMVGGEEKTVSMYIWKVSLTEELGDTDGAENIIDMGLCHTKAECYRVAGEHVTKIMGAY